MLAEILKVYILIVAFMTVGIAVYGMAVKPDRLKKIISFTILSDVVNVLALLIGFRMIFPVVAPILPVLQPTCADMVDFVRAAVDPVPQAFVITAVVIGTAVFVLLTFFFIQIYRLENAGKE